MKECIEKSIEEDLAYLAHYEERAGSESKVKLRSRYDKRTGKTNYYMISSSTGKEKYVRLKDLGRVKQLQEKALARQIADNLKRNIKLKQNFAKKLLPTSESEVAKTMPKAYVPTDRIKDEVDVSIMQSENPINPEDLNIVTSFGLYVRSKGELAIAEQLYSHNIEFYYERKLTIYSLKYNRMVDYYPDFTIVLPNGEIIYWEHEGLGSSPSYVENSLRKKMDYHYNGIYEAHNLIVSADGPNNSIDMEVISMIIGDLKMPKLHV